MNQKNSLRLKPQRISAPTILTIANACNTSSLAPLSSLRFSDSAIPSISESPRSMPESIVERKDERTREDEENERPSILHPENDESEISHPLKRTSLRNDESNDQ